METPSCRVISSTSLYRGKQGFDYQGAISAQSVGAKGVCMHLLTIPPGARAKAHLHQDHETAIYVLSGEASMWFGERLQEHMSIQAGDFVYIPAGVVGEVVAAKVMSLSTPFACWFVPSMILLP